ncbi:hypothetical protein EDEG_00524 [Edhazardia aedis USNM 41457]|uniref:Uncharacterized protein n=1 Tax=Edhazardia aedis (strain USNM 41457) TaxID=1003232 RepID=J9D123_EDHAE|nr:hypothetical protein EDEG_00524 [Edhazardia aedis USNM 41457]|eukprot:EJW01279.1 hypothetical protein EDEG_00524 [Edhazardia aedis USNM 41457]
MTNVLNSYLMFPRIYILFLKFVLLFFVLTGVHFKVSESYSFSRERSIRDATEQVNLSNQFIGVYDSFNITTPTTIEDTDLCEFRSFNTNKTEIEILDDYFQNLPTFDTNNVKNRDIKFLGGQIEFVDDFSEPLNALKKLIEEKNNIIVEKYNIAKLFDLLMKTGDDFEEQFIWKGKLHKQIFGSETAQIFIESGLSNSKKWDFKEEGQYIALFYDHYIRFSNISMLDH